jgi:hypothetical protein
MKKNASKTTERNSQSEREQRDSKSPNPTNETATKQQQIGMDNSKVDHPLNNSEISTGKAATATDADTNANTTPVLRISDFFQCTKWVLVKDGSYGGYFDWVPRLYRVGPWSGACKYYLAAVWFATVVAGVRLRTTERNETWRTIPTITTTDTTSAQEKYAPYQLYSLAWYYNAIGSVWMLFIVWLVWHGPLGIKAWGTYTVQSWTLLTLRHMLCAFAPISTRAALLAELIRFPVACSASVTFVVWNFALLPFGLLHMQTPDKKRAFLKFATSFRLSQLHVFNIALCYVQVALASPKRQALQALDFYMAAVSVVLYMTFYLLVLDRIGVHLYPVFSPRIGNWGVMLVWSSLVGVYASCFYAWKYLLEPID